MSNLFMYLGENGLEKYGCEKGVVYENQGVDVLLEKVDIVF